MKKDHAEHNESACDFLLKSGKYPDWVITTAFYSALHFVQHEIFPLKEDGKDYLNFDIYYYKLSRTSKKFKSKHYITKELVSIYIPSINGYYRWLFDNCMNSRYKSYNVSKDEAERARDFLSKLKNELKK